MFVWHFSEFFEKMLTNILENCYDIIFAKAKFFDSFYHCYLKICNFYELLYVILLYVLYVKLVTGNYRYFGNCFFLTFSVYSGTIATIVTYLPLGKSRFCQFPQRRKFSRKFSRKQKLSSREKCAKFRKNLPIIV